MEKEYWLKSFCREMFHAISTRKMDQPPAKPLLPARFCRVWPWLAVLAVLIFVGFIRVRLLQMPLERDEGEYAYAGQLILQGIPPYELAYNMKLPGTYLAYAAGMALFGQTVAGIHLTLLLVNSLTCLFVFLLGRKLAGAVGGLAACASYALMSVSTTVLGLAAHATQFVVLFAVPGTCLLWKAVQKCERGTVFLCGLLYGLAFVMKQPGACFGLFGLVVLLLHERHRSREGSKMASVKRIFFYALGGALPFLLICLWLTLAGVFPKFWFWTFSYARVYAAATPFGEGLSHLEEYLRNQFDFYLGFWVLAAAGLAACWRLSATRATANFVLGFLFFSFIGTTPGLYFREHYFVLLLPALAVAVGMSVGGLPWGRRAGFIPVVLLAAVCGWCLWLQRWAFFEMSPDELSRVIYRDNPLIESRQAAGYIREHSAPDARVAVLGSEPEIYFYAHRHSATGYIYTYPLMENQPYAAVMQQQMISEIESNQPEYLVLVLNRYSWLFRDNSIHEILDWESHYIAAHYSRVGVLDDRVATRPVQLWGAPAKNLSALPDQCVVVFCREPGLEQPAR